MDYDIVKGHKTKLAKLELFFFASDTRIRSVSSTLVCFIDARYIASIVYIWMHCYYARLYARVHRGYQVRPSGYLLDA